MAEDDCYFHCDVKMSPFQGEGRLLGCYWVVCGNKRLVRLASTILPLNEIEVR